MTKIAYSRFHSFVQIIASSSFGAWVFSHILHHFDLMLLKLTRGRAAVANLLAGMPVVMLTTIGAKSGLPRTLPLLFIRNEQNPTRFALVASNWGKTHYPAWYFNLKANPRASCALPDHAGDYIAHEASGEEYDLFWQYAVNTYIGYPLYKQRVGKRHIPIMVMTPV